MHGRNSTVIGDSKLLERKVPKNGRYSSISARVNTGNSITRHAKKIEEMQLNSQSRKNELFKRMKVTTLAQLVLQVANISLEEDTDFTPRTNDSVDEDKECSIPDETQSTISKYSLQSVIRGMGEVDVHDDMKPKPPPVPVPHLSRYYEDCPYLMLDIRDPDEFDSCHIIGARNFPVAMLSRTMNCFNKEILDYKNKLGKIIILYDEDERIAVSAATTMVQRGFDNIFVLSGGLKVLAMKIPEGLVTGSFPPQCRPTVVKTTGKHSSVTEKFKSRDQVVVTSDRSKKRFSGDDLDKISHHLNECLVPQDSASRLSRRSLTRNSAVSKISSASSRMSRKAWR